MTSFDFYRSLIKYLERGLGVEIEWETAQTLISWHRARAGPGQALLPQLRHLSVSFLVHDMFRAPPAWARNYIEPYYNTIPSTLAFLDVVVHHRITRFALRVDGVNVNGGAWREIRDLIDTRLGTLLKRCQLQTLDLMGGIPIATLASLHRHSLREVTLELGCAPAPQPEVAKQLCVWLSSLPNLGVLKLGSGTTGGFDSAITPTSQSKGLAGPSSSSTSAFPALFHISACLQDVQGCIPIHSRHQLRSLKLELRWDENVAIDALSDCITTCPNIETLSVTWSRVLFRGRNEEKFPWEAVVSLTHLVSLTVNDIWNTLPRPNDQQLKMLAAGCPKLQRFAWRIDFLPISSRLSPAEATLMGFASLASCPIVALNIPLHVSGPYVEIAPRRFSSRALRLGYAEWTYAQQDRAAAWIQDFLEDVCPLQMKLKDWLIIDHGHPGTIFATARQEARVMWQGLEASLECRS